MLKIEREMKHHLQKMLYITVYVTRKPCWLQCVL